MMLRKTMRNSAFDIPQSALRVAREAL